MTVYYTHGFKGGKAESRRLLRLAVAAYTGSSEKADALMAELTVCGSDGKPCIPGFDSFSVSHSEGAWAVLFSERVCGLDIQYPRDTRVMKIASRFYAEEDRAAVRSAQNISESAAAEMFFRIWTRREALVKALGVSVASDGLPSVIDYKVQAGNTEFIIRDIRLPGEPKLYAAICIETGEGAGEVSGSAEQPQFIELTRE